MAKKTLFTLTLILVLTSCFALSCEGNYELNPNESAYGNGPDCYSINIQVSMLTTGEIESQNELIITPELAGTKIELWKNSTKLCSAGFGTECRIKAEPATYTIHCTASGEYEFSTWLKTPAPYTEQEHIIETEPAQAFEPDQNTVTSWTKKTDKQGNTLTTLYNKNKEIIGFIEGNASLEDIIAWQNAQKTKTSIEGFVFGAKQELLETFTQKNLNSIKTQDINISSTELTWFETTSNHVFKTGYVLPFSEQSICDEESLLKLEELVSSLKQSLESKKENLSLDGEQITGALIESSRPSETCKKIEETQFICSSSLVQDMHSTINPPGSNCFSETSNALSDCKNCDAEFEKLGNEVYYLVRPEERVLEQADALSIGLVGLGMVAGTIACPETGATCLAVAAAGPALLLENAIDLVTGTARVMKNYEREENFNVMLNALVVGLVVADVPAAGKQARELLSNYLDDIIQLGLKHGISLQEMNKFVKNLEKKSATEFAGLILEKKLGKESFIRLVDLADNLPAKQLTETIELITKHNADLVIEITEKHGLQTMKLTSEAIEKGVIEEVPQLRAFAQYADNAGVEKIAVTKNPVGISIRNGTAQFDNVSSLVKETARGGKVHIEGRHITGEILSKKETTFFPCGIEVKNLGITTPNRMTKEQVFDLVIEGVENATPENVVHNVKDQCFEVIYKPDKFGISEMKIWIDDITGEVVNSFPTKGESVMNNLGIIKS